MSVAAARGLRDLWRPLGHDMCACILSASGGTVLLPPADGGMEFLRDCLVVLHASERDRDVLTGRHYPRLDPQFAAILRTLERTAQSPVALVLRLLMGIHAVPNFRLYVGQHSDAARFNLFLLFLEEEFFFFFTGVPMEGTTGGGAPGQPPPPPRIRIRDWHAFVVHVATVYLTMAFPPASRAARGLLALVASQRGELELEECRRRVRGDAAVGHSLARAASPTTNERS